MRTLPIVAMNAVRQGFLRDTGAKYNDIVYYSKPADWKFQTPHPTLPRTTFIAPTRADIDNVGNRAATTEISTRLSAGQNS